MLTSVPLILERTDVGVISFEITISEPQSSMPCSLKNAYKFLLLFSITSSIMAFSEPVLITSFGTLGAKTRSMALIIMLFPAPVSPVIMFKPLSKFAVNSSINM